MACGRRLSGHRMPRRQRDFVLHRDRRLVGIAQGRHRRIDRRLIHRQFALRQINVSVVATRHFRLMQGRHTGKRRFRPDREGDTARRRNGRRFCRRFKPVERLAGPDRRPGGQGFGDPLQLSHHHAQADDDQSAHDRGRAGGNQSIAKAEFVDRNTKSDHDGACQQGECADTD
jgi:hypothetical protein